jgi:hypothetical protein
MLADDMDMDEEIEKQLEAEARNNIYNEERLFDENVFNHFVFFSNVLCNLF